DLLGKHGGQLEFDRVIANVGYHADTRLYAALDMIPCPINGGPGPLASAVAARKVAKDRDPPALRPEMLVQAEPHFYVLGAKSYGRDSGFLLSHGFEQIRELFALIGDRAELDLYATMPAHH
ncbi:MAG TPA: hypothetical protein VHV08_17770, partial [Pirellulales bacterium]|nr:hypothetical protein [Pirellulales bacterium]